MSRARYGETSIDTNPSAPDSFVVRNGMLVSLGKPEGHLVTKQAYRDYRLEVEYRFPGKPGNCGVLVHASTPRELYGMFPKSIEVQMMSGNAGDFWCIIEDIRVPDMERRRGPRAEWGTTEGRQRRIRNLTDDSERPVGEWNSARIVLHGNHGEHWLNGVKVVEFDLGTPRLDSLLEKSKYKPIPGFAEHRGGHIILQDAIIGPKAKPNQQYEKVKNGNVLCFLFPNDLDDLG